MVNEVLCGRCGLCGLDKISAFANLVFSHISLLVICDDVVGADVVVFGDDHFDE